MLGRMSGPNLRDQFVPLVGTMRGLIDAFGVRRFKVYVRSRTWFNGTAPPWAQASRGVGYPVDTETLLAPTPKVRIIQMRTGFTQDFVATSAGQAREGDLLIEKITPDPNAAGGGVKPYQLMPTAAGTSMETHVVIEARAGSPHHHYEGTDRLLVPGPSSLSTACTTLNALATAYLAHFADAGVYGAHATADTRTIASATAVDLATGITRANELLSVWQAHRADLTLHVAVDAFPLFTTTPASDAQSLLVLTHALLRAFNQHVARGILTEAAIVGFGNDKSFGYSLLARPTHRSQVFG